MDNPSQANPIPPATGLFGGSFNPPHMAHVLVTAWALAGGQVGEVWVIPTGGHPFGKPLAPFDARLELCTLAFACFGKRVRILDVEREPRVHYSIDTLRALTRAYPGRRWRWIMGSDTLEYASQWKSWDELTALAPPLIVPRRAHVPETLATPGDFTLPDLSSTLLRRLLAERRVEGLEALIPRPVLDRILALGLYAAGGSVE